MISIFFKKIVVNKISLSYKSVARFYIYLGGVKCRLMTTTHFQIANQHISIRLPERNLIEAKCEIRSERFTL